MENLINSVPLDIIKRNINHFSIGEETPYLYPLANLAINEDGLEVDNVSIPGYQFINFGKLIQVACSVGASCLFHALNLKEKTYFLPNTCRIRKVNYSNTDGYLFLKAKAFSISSEKGKALVDIIDENGLVKYRLEQDCKIISEEVFSNLHKAHEYMGAQGVYVNTLPELKNVYIADNSFRIIIAGFSREHCQGYYSGFSIVPVTFLVNSIIAGIKEWFFREGIETGFIYIENSESFINKLVPVRTMLHAKVSVTKLQSELYLFTTEIIDLEGHNYGFYMLTIRIK